ncbi:LEM domain-containing protein 2-like [Carcharodon carcharias]|uniref:LEM domain-containing protein 2-like n=1 Tax=Carcharodon carcharias TaxID=13397 RepID=UPI001B7E406E|nr:LEM domain-containing protein 2-like [Carcharodon carcharias]
MASTVSDKDLRRELKALGYTAGPITDSTRSLYLKKLDQLQYEKSQKEQSSRAPRSRQSLWQREKDSPPPEPEPEPEQEQEPEQARRRRPGFVNSTRAELNREQADPEPPITHSTGYFTDRPHPVADGHEGTSDCLSSPRYTGISGSFYSDPYGRKSDSSYSNRYTGASGSLSSDPFTRKADSSYSDRFTAKYQSLDSNQYSKDKNSWKNSAGLTASAESDTVNVSSPCDSSYSKESDIFYSGPSTKKYNSLYSDPYTRKSDNLYSDPYTRKSDSSYLDKYTRKSDSSYSAPYTKTSDSSYSDPYRGKSDILSSDRYTRKYQSPSLDPYTRKSDSSYSDRYAGKSDSLSSDVYTRRLSSLYSDRYMRNSGSLYSDSHYKGKSDSLSETKRYTRQTAAGISKQGEQKPKNHLDKFEFYLSRFLQVATIVLCLVLAGLICVKTLGLLEGSEEDIGENIKMLPMDCSGKTDAFCQAEEHKIMMLILSEIYEYLAEMAGEFECGSEYPLKSKCIPVIDVKHHLAISDVSNLEKFDEALVWIIQSTRDLGIRLVGKDSEAEVTSVDQVTCLESTRPQMNLYCRLRNAVFNILHRTLIFILVLSLLWIMLILLKYQLKKMKEQQQAVYEMVNKIIGVVRAHNQDWENDLELIPYVPVPHVRDTLIQPEDRKKLKKTWQRAVQFLEANESRIRTETQRINGEDFLVWRWTQPSSFCDSFCD